MGPCVSSSYFSLYVSADEPEVGLLAAADAGGGWVGWGDSRRRCVSVIRLRAVRYFAAGRSCAQRKPIVGLAKRPGTLDHS